MIDENLNMLWDFCKQFCLSKSSQAIIENILCLAHFDAFHPTWYLFVWFENQEKLTVFASVPL